jgi:hypothetical protein
MGVTLYCMVAGKLPFSGESIAQLQEKIKTAPYAMNSIMPHQKAIDAGVSAVGSRRFVDASAGQGSQDAPINGFTQSTHRKNKNIDKILGASMGDKEWQKAADTCCAAKQRSTSDTTRAAAVAAGLALAHSNIDAVTRALTRQTGALHAIY